MFEDIRVTTRSDESSGSVHTATITCPICGLGNPDASNSKVGIEFDKIGPTANCD